MFYAENTDGNTWYVTETDDAGEVISSGRVAVKSGGGAEDAIATLQEARLPPTEAAIAAGAQATRIAEIKAACSRRILDILDIYTVSNIQGAFVAGELDEAQMVLFRSGRKWVAAMQDASRAMILDPLLPDHTSDNAWPDVPAGVATLAADF